MLAKPQSYMNASGGPVKQLAAAYGATPDDIVVIPQVLHLRIIRCITRILMQIFHRP